MPKLSLDELAVQYGFAAAFFNSDPELAKLIKDAVAGQWSVPKFQSKFMNTNWYRSREASVRQWADLMARDPAEATNKINESKSWLSDQFSQLGVEIDDATLSTLALNRLQWSWSDSQTQDILASFIAYEPGETAGTVAAIETSIKDLAYQYGVDVSDLQMQDWISGIVSQSYTQDSLNDYIRDMARSKYSGMTGYLDAGMTTRQVAAPYLQEFSKLMEVSPDTINLDDPLIARAIQGTLDPQTGKSQMMTVSQMQKAIKADQRWLYTGNAKDSMTDLGLGILRDMGLVA